MKPNRIGKLRGLDLKVRNMLTGFLAAIPAGTVLRVGTTQMKVADITTALQSKDSQRQSVRDLDAQHHAAKVARDGDTPATRQLIADLKVAVVGYFGRSSEDLVQFGVKPYQPSRKLTADELVDRKEKAAATIASKKGKKPPSTNGSSTAQ